MFDRARAILLVLFSVVLAGGAQTANLLLGDADVEIDPQNMTNGSYTNSTDAAPKWRHDTTTGYHSGSSIKLVEFSGIGIHDVPLPAGTYTLSCWAKSSQPGGVAYLTVNRRRGGWPEALKHRAASSIRLTTEWKRYSYTFQADGKSNYSPYYGIDRVPAWFDRFMLNAGDRALPWVPTTRCLIHVAFPGIKGHVFPLGQEVRAVVTLRKFTADPITGPLTITTTDYLGQVVGEKMVTPVFDDKGLYETAVPMPRGRSGWYMVMARLPGLDPVHANCVITRPPEPTIPECEPFVGLCGGENFLEAMKLIGVKWLQMYIEWFAHEVVPGKYNFRSFERLRGYKDQGFKLMMLVTSGVPDWAIPPQVSKEAAKLGLTGSRLLPPREQLPAWRKYVRAYMERFPDLADLYELGGELDALIGLNTYYKRRDTKHMLGSFVLGQAMDDAVAMMDIAAEEIRRVRPQARISAVRPSDVDARYAYAYSREFTRRLAQPINCFGVDCYPQPRWIGPGQPPVGLEQQLATRYRDASAFLNETAKKHIYIAEYGYFIDHHELTNPKWLGIQANRLARSYLKARLVGMKSLHYYTTESTGLEGKHYHMGLWNRKQPLPAVSALNNVERVVDNVKVCEEIRISDNAGIGMFGKYDGRAVGALWSIATEAMPAVVFPDDHFQMTDVMGNPLPLEKKDGRIRLQLGQFPIYVWRTARGEDNYARLAAAFRQMRVDEPLPAEITLRPESVQKLKVYLKSTALSRDNRGVVAYEWQGRKVEQPFTMPGGQTVIVRVPLPAEGQDINLKVCFEGGYQPYPCSYRTPQLLKVPRIPPLPADGRLDKLSALTPVSIGGRDHIHPVDHTTYDGEQDLSAKLYLAYDGANLYFTADVTDDIHSQPFPLTRLWRGDCIQFVVDPRTNYIGKAKKFDPDDAFYSVGLVDGKHAFIVHQAPQKARLQRESFCRIFRDEKSHRTFYQMRIPLAALDADLRPGRIFGFNCVAMDDDNGSGADYWLFLRQGLAGGQSPDKFVLCLLK